MDLSLVNEWLDQVVTNLPVLIVSILFIGSIFAIAYKIISTQNKMVVEYIKQAEQRQEEEKQNREEFRKDVYSQLSKTLDIYQDVQIAIPLIKSFMDRYPKIENVITVLNQNKHSYYDFLESIISRAKYAFKSNFKNGSHEEVADKVIDKSHQQILSTISNEDDLLHKPYHVIFADLMKEELSRLTKELLRMDEAAMKLDLIDSFFGHLRDLVYNFRIHLNDTYLKMKPEEVKQELRKFLDGKQVRYKEEEKGFEEVDETEQIFGF